MPAKDLIGTTIDNKYRIEALLGEGGMGVVYQALHLLIGRKVAVKFLHASLAGNEEVVKRFFREARSAAAIEHKNIIDVLDVGVTPDGEPYLVMESLEGEGLADLLEREQYLDLEMALGILEPALIGLAAAHDKNIVHRDLKPENIFLVHQPDEAPTVKLIDFGISKITSGSKETKLTADGSMLGTPAYMSPEQARGSTDVDHRTDVYAMGVILYEMLCGETPFTGEQYNEILYNVLTGEPRDPIDLRADFPASAWLPIKRALSRDPADRFQSARELLEALRDIVPEDGRRKGMTLLGEAMVKDNFASGDIGKNVSAIGDTMLAANLLEQSVRDQKSQGIVGLARAKLRGFVKTELRPRFNGPNRRLYRGGAAAAAVLLMGIFVIGLCSGDDDLSNSVSIAVKGVPRKAKIYYEDSFVPINPFKVMKGDTIVPLRVELAGYETFRISVIPSKDQVVRVKLVRKTKKKTAKPATKPAEKPQGKKPQSEEPEEESPAKKKGKQSKGRKFLKSLKDGFKK